MATPLLGWISPADRTQEQHDAHAAAVAKMPRFSLPDPSIGLGPVKLMLGDAWKHPDVVADIGFAFPRFHQLTGSCVGAGGGNALMTLICVQRLIADTPTKAFVPFWPFDYGRCRYNEGDRGQGEGAMGSSFADTLVKEGVIDAATAGLPAFQNNDGLVLTSALEMQWSNGASSTVTQYLSAAKVHPLGSAAPVSDIGGLKAGILNGYPATFACDRYIGNASIQGSGANARVVGRWNNGGGHQQYVFGYEDNPDLGPLFNVGNNWPGSTYPADPGGAPICSCWVKANDVTAAFGYNSEVYLLSHMPWFPAQPKLLHWII